MTNLKTYHNLDSNDSLAHFRKEFIHQEMKYIWMEIH